MWTVAHSWRQSSGNMVSVSRLLNSSFTALAHIKPNRCSLQLKRSSSKMAASCGMLLLLITSCFIYSSLGVDRGNFKTCDQSGFCKRQRNHQSGDSQYMALLETVKVVDSQMSVELLNKKTKVHLKLSVTGLDGNIARLRIVEVEPVNPRYEPPVGDVLVGEPKLQNFDSHSEDTGSVRLTLNKNEIVLQADPLRIDFIVDGELVMSVNARGLMKFEINRKKDAEPPKPPGEEEEKPEGAENTEEKEAEEQPKTEEEPDLFEETFKGHTDSKPNGPSSIGLDFSFPGFESVYGIPEHADTLALKSTKSTDPYRLYNLDVFEYELNNPMALYGSIPFLVAHNEKKTLGLFWLNAAETWVDIASNVADKNLMSKLASFVTGDNEIPQVDTHWFSESGIIDVFFLMGPSAKDVFKQYAILTGTTQLPPIFSIAYHQSRWNYNDEQDVANVNEGFDKHNIPMDVIWLDIEHTDGKRYFTWDGNKFPHSIEMARNVSAKGRKIVTIVDPHIKRDDGYRINQQMRDAGYYIKNKDGADYDGWCWPGSSSWPDFTRPDVRQFWAQKFLLDEYEGTTMDVYTWNDMNEPSVFNGPEITMHKDAKHAGGWEHRDVHNIYGMYVQRATWEGQLLRSENKERPFVLSRAVFAGTQRYGAVWTGDNTGEWGHLKASIPMVLSLSLAGVTFSGADVGGFFKNPDAELLLRWYQAAAYQPFFRAHAHMDTRRREPWLYDENQMEVIRQAVQARYRLLPYWYTLFYENEHSGMPPMRPLWVEFPTDKATFNIEDAHMVGSALLVRPVTDAGASGVKVYLPGEDEVYYDADTYKSFTGNQHLYVTVNILKIPVFIRGGHIIPRKDRIRRASTLAHSDPFTLVVALDKKGNAEGELYTDDYHTYEYKNGQYAHRRFTFSNNRLVNRNADEKGVYKTKSWLERVILVGVKSQPRSVTLTGAGVAQSLDFTYSADKQVLTIRKPAVNIAEDWKITLN